MWEIGSKIARPISINYCSREKNMKQKITGGTVSICFVTLFAISILLPVAHAMGEGDNPVEQHWTESGTIQIEHTINETHDGVSINQYLNSLTSYYHSPHM